MVLLKPLLTYLNLQINTNVTYDSLKLLFDQPTRPKIKFMKKININKFWNISFTTLSMPTCIDWMICGGNVVFIPLVSSVVINTIRGTFKTIITELIIYRTQELVPFRCNSILISIKYWSSKSSKTFSNTPDINYKIRSLPERFRWKILQYKRQPN